jgi:hypothetical protein
MAKLTPITARQRDLLRNIADPPPDWFLSGHDATSVYALRARGLVSTHSPMSYHTAKITKKGQDLLEGRVTAMPAPAREAKPPTPRPPKPLKIPGTEVIAKAVAAGGELRIPDPDAALRHRWRQGIHEAVAAELAPAGKRLRHRGRDQGDLVVWLEDAVLSELPAPEYPEVVVPERASKYHPILAATRAEVGTRRSGDVYTYRWEGCAHVNVSAGAFGRAMRILQSLIDEFIARGHQIGLHKGYRCSGGLAVIIHGHPLELVVVGETERDLSAAAGLEGVDSRSPQWPRKPSGRLQLRAGHGAYDKTLAADRKRWTLDQRLGRVVVELEHRAAELEERRLEKEREQERRRIAWEHAIARAEADLQEHHRAEVLEDQLNRWRLAQEITAYADAVAASRGEHVTNQERAWLDWAVAYARAIDPLHGELAFPAPVKSSPEALKPFLGGVNPYGPERYW